MHDSPRQDTFSKNQYQTNTSTTKQLDHLHQIEIRNTSTRPYQLITCPQCQLDGIQEDYCHHKRLKSRRIQEIGDKLICYELLSMTLIHIHNVIKILFNYIFLFLLLLLYSQNRIDLNKKKKTKLRTDTTGIQSINQLVTHHT